MTPNKLYLKNFIGIQSGLGLDEIEIDFDELTEGAELVALFGPNGKGKSTILDNMHPFRIMPSRCSSYSAGSFSYYDQIFDDAVKVLHWKDSGRKFRSTINIKGSTKQRKTEAFLHQLHGDTWKACQTGEGEAVSDGKTATYDKAVEYIIGTSEMYFTAAFASQSKPPLSGYTNGEIKSLMSELLGLESVNYLFDQASQVVKGLVAKHTGMQQALVMISTDEDDIKKFESRMISESTMLKMYSDARFKARQNIQSLSESLSRIRADSITRTDVEDKKSALNSQLDNILEAAEKRVRELSKEMNVLRTDKINNENDHNANLRELNSQIERARSAIKDCELLIAQKPDIELAIEAVETLSNSHIDVTKRINIKKEDVETKNKYNTNLLKMNNTLSEIGYKIQNIESKIDQLSKQGSLVEEVPCNGTDLQEKCQLLKSAIQAKADIIVQNQHLEQLKLEYDEIEIRVKNGKTALKKFDGIDIELAELEHERDSLISRLEDSKHLASKMDSVNSAEVAVKTWSNEVILAEDRIAELTYQYDAKQADIMERITEHGDKINAVEAGKMNESEVIQEQLSQLPSLEGPDPAAEAQRKLNESEQALTDAEVEVDKYTESVAQLKAKIQVATDEAAKVKSIKEKLQVLNKEIAKWKLLSSALGKDGIIALSIDDAGPTISSLANALLLECYGPRFTISIDTQSETASGSMKETFDITVFDAWRDEKKSIKVMSGGERVWINECITRAFALFQAEQSSQTYETLFTDETDGPLDPARKTMFMKMKRTVLKLGGYKKEFFISHTPELLDMADAIIDLQEFESKAT